MDTASSEGYIRALELPAAPPRFEALGVVPAGPAFSTGEQAIVVGSQLAQFSGALDPRQRAAVADSLLLAQLAANKAADALEDVFGWYRKYVEVLQGIGWQVGSLAFESQAVSDRDAGLHQAIVPVVAAMLGPVAAAGSLVLSVLDGLSAMDRERPWLAAFDRASRHARGAHFQVGTIGANEAGDPEVGFLCFAIDARRSLTQVLFFRVAAGSAELRKAQGHLSMPGARLMATSTAIGERVGPFVADYVKNIEL